MRTFVCPSCGGEVRFLASTTFFAVCSWCRSTLIRDDLNVSILGKVAELPEDMSPLRLGSEGQDGGVHFIVVGRIVREWRDGRWSEWYVMRDDGACGWLSESAGELAMLREDNSSYANKFPFESSRVGLWFDLPQGQYVVTDIKAAKVAGVEGELPRSVKESQRSVCIDLDGPDGRCATFEQSPDQTRRVYLGGYTDATALRLSNLRVPPGW